MSGRRSLSPLAPISPRGATTRSSVWIFTEDEGLAARGEELPTTCYWFPRSFRFLVILADGRPCNTSGSYSPILRHLLSERKTFSRLEPHTPRLPVVAPQVELLGPPIHLAIPTIFLVELVPGIVPDETLLDRPAHALVDPGVRKFRWRFSST